MLPAPMVQVWDATGSTAVGVLGGFTALTVSDVLSGVGSLRLSVTRGTPGVDLLEVDTDWQLRVMQAGVPDLWFISDEDSSTYVSDDPATEPVEVTCRSIAGLLDEAVVVPQGGIGTTPADWEFIDATPGKVVADLFASAQSRGLLQGVTLTGSATVDATGQAWPSTVTITYRAGTTLTSVLQGLAKSLLLEWWFNGRALEIHAPGEGLDRTLTSAFRPGRDVLTAPLTRSRRAVASAVVVEGEGSSTTRRTQSLTGYRAREVYVSQTQVADTDIDAIGDLYLAAHADADVQITHDLTADATGAMAPWVDYRPGDRVPTAAASLTGVVTRRIQQVAVTWTAAGGATVALELGSILVEAETRMAQQIQRLLPGAQSL